MNQPAPTGRREHRDGKEFLVIERRFTAPIESVWAAVTEPERLARWIGTWTGDPASGAVDFRMLYEGEGPATEVFTILECEEPRRLAVTSTVPFDEGRLVEWHLTLDLTEAAGVTTLAFGAVRARAGDGRERRARLGVLPRPPGRRGVRR